VTPLASYKLMIREFHLDAYGHVNNAMYLTMYEEARWEQVTANGYGFNRVHETGIGPVILEIKVKFLKELRLRETIEIRTQVTMARGLTCRLSQQMINEKNEIASQAEFTFGLFDLKKRKLIPATPEWSKALGLSHGEVIEPSIEKV
jgi:thioesterase III